MGCKTKHHMITKSLWIKLHWFDSQHVWVGVYAVVLSLLFPKMQMQNVANNTNPLLCGVFSFLNEDFTVLRIACVPVCVEREMWIQSWLCLSLSEKTVHCIWIQFVLKPWKVTHALIHIDCSCSDCVKSFQCKKKKKKKKNQNCTNDSKVFITELLKSTKLYCLITKWFLKPLQTD